MSGTTSPAAASAVLEELEETARLWLMSQPRSRSRWTKPRSTSCAATSALAGRRRLSGRSPSPPSPAGDPMPRFAANLSMMYTGARLPRPFRAPQRMTDFARSNTSFRMPSSATEIASRLARTAACNRCCSTRRRATGTAASAAWPACPAAKTSSGAALPSRPCRMREALHCPRIHVMAGLLPAGADRSAHRAAYRRQPGLGGAAGGVGRHRCADRADQQARHPGLLPEPPGRCARGGRRSRRQQPEGADGPVPLPDRRRRPGDEAAPVPADRPRRPPADRRRAAAP